MNELNNNLTLSSNKKINRNILKIRTENNCNEGISNFLIDGQNSSFSDIKINFKELLSKANEKGILKSNSSSHLSSLSILNISNISSSSLNLKYVPKSKLSFSKIKSIPLKNNNKVNIETTLGLKKPLFFLSKGINEYDQLSFKSKYMVTIIQIMDKYLKTRNNYIEYISKDRKNEIDDYYNQLKSYNNEFINFLFDDLGKNLDFFLWKKLVIYVLERIKNHFKILENILIELSESINKYNMLNKKNIALNYSNLKVEKMNNILNENYKSITEREKVYKLKKINSFNTKINIENIYKLENFKLNSEIEDLTLLLNKNKDYYKKYVELTNELENKNLSIKKLNQSLYQVTLDLNVKNAILNDIEKKYEEKISNLKNEKNINIKNLDLLQKISVDDKTKIKKLQILQETVNERLIMLNEEMQSWIYLYLKEKKEHIQTKKTLETCENIIRLKEEV